MKVFSLPPIVSENPKVLILGTMPGIKSLEANQYYAHGGNKFWPILFDLFQAPYSHAYAARERLIKENQLALWDVLKACIRESSADSNISTEEPNDIDTLLREKQGIKAICFNGNKAWEYFQQYFMDPGIPLLVLPSTSPANTWKTYDEKLKEWSVILRFIR